MTTPTPAAVVTQQPLADLCAQRLAGVLTRPARLTPHGTLLAAQAVLHLEFQPAMGLACEANLLLGPDDAAEVRNLLPQLHTGALVSVGGEGVRLAVDTHQSPLPHAHPPRLHLINARQLVVPCAPTLTPEGSSPSC